MSKIRKTYGGQTALEYLIVIGIALFILTGLLGYTYYYTTGYNSAKSGQSVTLGANSIQSAVNYLSAQQSGSVYNFVFTSQGLDIKNSYFCNNFLALAYNGFQASESLLLPAYGEMPLGAGEYSAEAVSTIVGGSPAVDVRFNLPIGFVNSSFYLSGSILKYNMSFQTFGGASVSPGNITIYVYTLANSLLASSNLTNVGNSYAGSINITQPYSNVKFIVYFPSLNIASASCVKAAHQIAITLSNLQTSATSAPFQQQIYVNSSEYSKYEANNLSNIEFSYFNGTIIPSWLEGGDIASFNGINSYIKVPNSGSINIIGKTLTLSAWVYINQYGGANDQAIVVKWNQGTGDQYGLWLNNSGWPLVALGGIDENGHILGKKIPLDTWQLVTFTYNGSTESVFQNGVLTGSAAVSGSFSVYDGPAQILSIGGQSQTSFRYFNGSISNVQIYSGALIGSQISQLYSEGMGGSPVTTSSLAGWWQLGGNAIDISGNGNNGTSSNVTFSGAGAGSTSTSYWVKLNSGISANSQTVVYMNFYPTSANLLNSKNNGEAPELSPTYGKYDDGANIFNFYDNFSGTTLNSVRWSNTDPAKSYSVNNGLTVLNGTSTNIVANTAYPVNKSIIEFRGKFNGTLSTSVNLFGAIVAGEAGIGDADSASSIQLNNYNGAQCDNATSIPINTYGIYGIYLTSQLTVAYSNYVSVLSTKCDHNTATQVSPDFYSRVSPVISIIATYVRVRAYPPNGVMPSVSFGQFE